MKFKLIPILLLSLATASVAEPVFNVDLVSKDRANVFIDNAWQTGVDAVQAKVSVTEDAATADVDIKAYFYNSNYKLVHEAKKPSMVNNMQGGSVVNPTHMDSGKKYEFYFGVPAIIQKGDDKWRRDLSKFEFPEKEFVKE